MIRVCSRSAADFNIRCPSPKLNEPLRHNKLLQNQTRSFFDSIIKSGLPECSLRSLSHTKTIPYSSKATFRAVADVAGYPAFLPFTISSHVVSRDIKGYPTRAKIKIGYEKLGLEENWDSLVHCDPETGIVEARSSEQGSGGLFEILRAKWHIHGNGETRTSVKLDVDVKFRNALYDQMFAQVEGKVASTMISAFEKKVQEVEAHR